MTGGTTNVARTARGASPTSAARTTAMREPATDDAPRRPQSWPQKFNCALRGLRRGVRSEVNFFVHFFVAAIVIAAGMVLEVSRLEWCLLIVCIGAVLVAELFNTALETIARVVTDRYNSQMRDALDMGSGAVLLASITAAIVGAAIFIPRLASMLDLWPE